jgi:hypothetical protein
MDKIKKYKDILQAEMEYQATKTLYKAPNVHRHLVVNEDKTDFVLFSYGWKDGAYIYTVLHHLQLREDKIWVLKNNTTVLLDDIFIEEGVDRNDIEIAWAYEELGEEVA